MLSCAYPVRPVHLVLPVFFLLWCCLCVSSSGTHRCHFKSFLLVIFSAHTCLLPGRNCWSSEFPQNIICPFFKVLTRWLQCFYMSSAPGWEASWDLQHQAQCESSQCCGSSVIWKLNKYMMREHWLLEKCKSKLQWGITSHWAEWPSKKNLQTINATEDVEKREPFYTVGGNVNWCSHYGEQYGGSSQN